MAQLVDYLSSMHKALGVDPCHMHTLGMLVHGYNPDTLMVRQEDHKFKVFLSSKPSSHYLGLHKTLSQINK